MLSSSLEAPGCRGMGEDPSGVAQSPFPHLPYDENGALSLGPLIRQGSRLPSEGGSHGQAHL